jgi:hypothetical protein
MSWEHEQGPWALQVAHIGDEVRDPEATALVCHDVFPWRRRVEKFGRNPFSLVTTDVPATLIIVRKTYAVVPYEALTIHVSTGVFQHAYHVEEDASFLPGRPSIFYVHSLHPG